MTPALHAVCREIDTDGRFITAADIRGSFNSVAGYNGRINNLGDPTDNYICNFAAISGCWINGWVN